MITFNRLNAAKHSKHCTLRVAHPAPATSRSIGGLRTPHRCAQSSSAVSAIQLPRTDAHRRAQAVRHNRPTSTGTYSRPDRRSSNVSAGAGPLHCVQVPGHGSEPQRMGGAEAQTGTRVVSQQAIHDVNVALLRRPIECICSLQRVHHVGIVEQAVHCSQLPVGGCRSHWSGGHPTRGCEGLPATRGGRQSARI